TEPCLRTSSTIIICRTSASIDLPPVVGRRQPQPNEQSRAKPVVKRNDSHRRAIPLDSGDAGVRVLARRPRLDRGGGFLAIVSGRKCWNAIVFTTCGGT